ncbi:MAG TPA: ABC transporter permease subunit [Nitriliruptorales bacterium]
MDAHVLRITRWEVQRLVRLRWLPAMVGLFAVGCLVNAFLGLRSLRALGLTGIGASLDGLVAIGVLLPPLLALVLGAGALSGARERDLLSLLAAQPIRRSTIVLGTFLAVSAVVSATVGLGFGAALVVLSGVAGATDLWGLTVVVLATLGTSVAAAAVGVLLGAVTSNRLQAVAAAVLAWFALALGLDLLFAGLAPGLHLGPRSLLVAVLVNPVETGRVLTLLATRSDPATLGPFGAYLDTRFGLPIATAMLGSALAAWIVLPVTGACLALRHRDV